MKVTNTTKGGLVTPSGVFIAPNGGEAEITADDAKNPVIAAWLDGGGLVSDKPAPKARAAKSDETKG